MNKESKKLKSDPDKSWRCFGFTGTILGIIILIFLVILAIFKNDKGDLPAFYFFVILGVVFLIKAILGLVTGEFWTQEYKLTMITREKGIWKNIWVIVSFVAALLFFFIAYLLLQ